MAKAVVGPNADDVEVLLGNYSGTPSKAVTPLAGLKNYLGERANVIYARGCGVLDTSKAGFVQAVAAASLPKLAT